MTSRPGYSDSDRSFPGSTLISYMCQATIDSILSMIIADSPLSQRDSRELPSTADDGKEDLYLNPHFIKTATTTEAGKLYFSNFSNFKQNAMPCCYDSKWVRLLVRQQQYPELK